MKLISWNVNGVRAVAKKGLYEFIAEESPDVLCIQETKIQHDQLEKADLFNEELLPSPHTYFKSAAEKKGYSGVLTLIEQASSQMLVPESISYGIGESLYDSEGRFVVTDFGDFLLYNVYVPSGTTGELRQDFKYSFLDSFYDHISKLSRKDRERLVICGDFNICHKPIDIHHPATAEKRQLSGFLPEERAWLDRFIALGLSDSYRLFNEETPDQYTWWSYRAGSRGKNLGWRIDYFFVGDAIRSKVKGASILKDVMGSDHCPLVLELELS